MKTFFLSTILFLVSFCSLNALNHVWTGGNGNWHTAGNWDVGTVPNFGDHVEIASSVTVTIYANNIAKAKSIYLGGDSKLIVNANAYCRVKSTNLNIRNSVENWGDIEVKGTFIVKNTFNSGNSAFRNSNSVEIVAGGTLRIWGIAATAFINSGTLTNRGLFRICDVPTGLINNSNAVLYNHDSLSIHDTQIGIDNLGTANNYGSIGLTENQTGLDNQRIFYNRFHGDIYIDAGDIGIKHSNDFAFVANSFTNFGDIEIANQSDQGVLVVGPIAGKFINKPAGDIIINDSEDSGFECSDQSIIENFGKIDINNTGRTALLVDYADFTNKSTGEITVKDAFYGLEVKETTSNNFGRITIEDNSYGCRIENSIFNNFFQADLVLDNSNSAGLTILSGSEYNNSGDLKTDNSTIGIVVFGEFTNFSLGMIYISNNDFGVSTYEGFLRNQGYMQVTNSSNYAISHFPLCEFTSSGQLIVAYNELGVYNDAGALFSIEGFAEFFDNNSHINFGTFRVKDFGELVNYDQFVMGITNSSTFINSGFVRDNYAGPGHYGIGYINYGVVSDLNELGSWDTLNSSYITQPWDNVQVGLAVSNALNKVLSNHVNVLGIYTDMTSLTLAGTYVVATDQFTPDNIAVGLNTVYARMQDVSSGVIDYFEIPVNGSIQPLVGSSQVLFRKSIASEPEFKVFPNPTFGEATLNISNVEEGLIQIKVIDILGRIVESKEVEANGNQDITILEDNQLVPGQYILTVTQDGAIIHQTPIIRN